MTACERARAELEAVFRAALGAADGAGCVRRAIVRRGGEALELAGFAVPRGGRLRLLAAGKAAAPMTAAFEAAVGERLVEGLAITKDGHGVPLARSALREAGHPFPDARGARAAREALALAERAGPDDVLVVLLSGGASALTTLPQPGLSLEDVRATTAALLAAGSPIEELNAVRKHLTELSGGRLAQRTRAATIVLLALSDVRGDRLDVIGSGPCVPDPTTFADAWAVVERRRLADALPAAALAHLRAGLRGERPESPKPGEAGFGRVHAAVLASGRTALDAAADMARRRGLAPVRVTEDLGGEARRAGRRIAALARSLRAPGARLLLAAGETTVTVVGDGRGGRSQELALAAALELEGSPGACLLAAGTDGTDGPTDAAGAWADAGTAARGRARGCDPARALARNDAYGFFATEGGLFRTGPTGTNVRDLVLLRVAE